MSYLIYKSDGTAVTIPDNAIDTVFYNSTGGGGYGPGNVPQSGHGLGTQLIGRNTIGYGAAIAQNFLQLQENFSSSSVPSDTFSLQGQLWFNQLSTTTGDLYVRSTTTTSGGIANWKKIVVTDSSGNLTVTGNLTVIGTATASEFIGPATALFGGTNHQIPVQTAPNTTGFIVAPTVTGTFLEWNGSAFVWATPSGSGGTVSSVGVSSNGSASAALTIGASPITTSGTITITPNLFSSGSAGVTPSSGGGTTNFLRADGNWAAPPGTGGGGTVTSVGLTSAGSFAGAIVVTGSPVTTSGSLTITAHEFASATPGVVSASGGGTTNFLRADGNWAAPPNSGGTVTSIAVSGGSTGLTTAGGPVTTAGTITFAGTLNVANGGTGVNSLTSNGVLVGNGTSDVTVTAAGTTGQVFIGNSSADPSWSSIVLVSGSGIAVTGAITATGDITAFFSDRRLKENVKPITNALEKVQSLHGISYTPNSLAESFGYNKSEKLVGVYADELSTVLPEAVKLAPFDNENGNSISGENYQTVQYEKIVPLLIEAIKELNLINKSLLSRIEILEGL